MNLAPRSMFSDGGPSLMIVPVVDETSPFIYLAGWVLATMALLFMAATWTRQDKEWPIWVTVAWVIVGLWIFGGVWPFIRWILYLEIGFAILWYLLKGGTRRNG